MSELCGSYDYEKRWKLVVRWDELSGYTFFKEPDFSVEDRGA